MKGGYTDAFFLNFTASLKYILRLQQLKSADGHRFECHLTAQLDDGSSRSRIIGEYRVWVAWGRFTSVGRLMGLMWGGYSLDPFQVMVLGPLVRATEYWRKRWLFESWLEVGRHQCMALKKEINVQQTHSHSKQLVNTDWEMSQNVRADLSFRTPATFVLTLLFIILPREDSNKTNFRWT